MNCKVEITEKSSFQTVEQIDKLKVLSESLVSSTSKAEKRISDHRYVIAHKNIVLCFIWIIQLTKHFAIYFLCFKWLFQTLTYGIIRYCIFSLVSYNYHNKLYLLFRPWLLDMNFFFFFVCLCGKWGFRRIIHVMLFLN